jgi:SOS response regulatory protein OraA/RecX
MTYTVAHAEQIVRRSARALADRRALTEAELRRALSERRAAAIVIERALKSAREGAR